MKARKHGDERCARSGGSIVIPSSDSRDVEPWLWAHVRDAVAAASA